MIIYGSTINSALETISRLSEEQRDSTESRSKEALATGRSAKVSKESCSQRFSLGRRHFVSWPLVLCSFIEMITTPTELVVGARAS